MNDLQGFIGFQSYLIRNDIDSTEDLLGTPVKKVT